MIENKYYLKVAIDEI